MIGDPVRIDLTVDERKLLVSGLHEYTGPAKGAPVLAPLVGADNTQEFFGLLGRLVSAIETDQPLSDLDWTRALLLTEISWASDILGPHRRSRRRSETARPFRCCGRSSAKSSPENASTC